MSCWSDVSEAMSDTSHPSKETTPDAFYLAAIEEKGGRKSTANEPVERQKANITCALYEVERKLDNWMDKLEEWMDRVRESW